MRRIIGNNGDGLVLLADLASTVEDHFHGRAFSCSDNPVLGTYSSTAAAGLNLADDQVRFSIVGNGKYMFNLLTLLDRIEFKGAFTEIYLWGIGPLLRRHAGKIFLDGGTDGQAV